VDDRISQGIPKKLSCVEAGSTTFYKVGSSLLAGDIVNEINRSDAIDFFKDIEKKFNIYLVMIV
jgi:ribosome biogenesis protein Tsr3